MGTQQSTPKAAVTHKAAFVLVINGTFVVQPKPTPSTPGDNELLVKIYAAGVNPSDAARRAGAWNPHYPAIFGSDSSGVVTGIGKSVKGFKEGDRIFFQSSSGNPDKAGFQEYVLAPSHLVAKLPDNVTFISGATLPLTSLTAFKGLFHSSGLDIPPPFHDQPSEQPSSPPTGPSLLVIGGSSQVGQFTIQFASRFAKFKTIWTTASDDPANVEHLKSLGVTHVLPRNISPARLSEVINGPIDHVIDAVSFPETQGLALEFLRDNITTWPIPRGTQERQPKLVLFRDLAYPVGDVPNGLTIKTPFGSSYGDQEWSSKFWASIGGWLEQGLVIPSKVQLYEGLAKTEDAVQAVEKGVHGVKCVIQVAQ